MAENPKNVKRSIRIPRGLHDLIESRAKAMGISANKYIIEILRKEVG